LKTYSQSSIFASFQIGLQKDSETLKPTLILWLIDRYYNFLLKCQSIICDPNPYVSNAHDSKILMCIELPIWVLLIFIHLSLVLVILSWAKWQLGLAFSTMRLCTFLRFWANNHFTTYAMEHMLILHTHFDPTLAQYESFQVISSAWGASFVPSISHPKPTIEIEMKKIINAHLIILSMWVFYKP
jgi:hypothetical protein